MADNSPLACNWFALCDVDRLGERAIYHTELAGNELVVWQAEDGAINVWENRCPHRGVRLSIGHHRGEALQCQYHGWQFGSGDGGCRFVPAHPDAAPPSVAVKTWPVEVRDGFVWTCIVPAGETPPPFVPLDELASDAHADDQIRLRTVAIDASSDAVQRALAGYGFDHAQSDPWKTAECVTFDAGPHALVVEQLDDARQRVVFLLQPAREGRTYLHGVALGVAARDVNERLNLLRHHQQRLNALRDALESRNVPSRVEKNPGRAPLAMPAAWVDAQVVFGQPGASQSVSPTPTPTLKPASTPARALTPGFANSGSANRVEDHAFTVHLSRSKKTLTVAADASLLQTLREHHVVVPTSCEQGVCGTCRTRVIDGTPLHRDDYLTPAERAAGDCMLVCVSRAAGAALTLDL